MTHFPTSIAATLLLASGIAMTGCTSTEAPRPENRPAKVAPSQEVRAEQKQSAK